MKHQIWHRYVYVGMSMLSRVQLFVTLWIVAHQAPLSMGFPRQEYWSRLPFAFPRYLPQSGIKPSSPALQADSLLLTYQLSGSQSWYFIE